MDAKISLLATGLVDVGGIARSANNIGHNVYTIDFFGDLDVRRCSNQSLSILEEYRRMPHENFDLSKILMKLTKKMVIDNNIDSILLASGLDDEGDLLQSLNELIPILGNTPDIIKKVRSKLSFFDELRRMGLTFPETQLACNFEEGLSVIRDIGFPVVIKPTKGYGGVGIKKLERKKDLEKIFNNASKGEWLIQEYVPGIPASVSIIANGSKAKVLSLNEQLLGEKEYGQLEDFGYSGNIVPLEFDDNIIKKCEELANRIVVHFGLKGSNGIDLVISDQSDRLSVIEVNPRFQGTLECIEKYLNMNLVEMHVKACSLGKLPVNINRSQSIYFGRMILFAMSNINAPNVTLFNFTRDIPNPGSEISKGEPICSIMTQSSNRSMCLKKIEHLAEMIYSRGRSHERL